MRDKPSYAGIFEMKNTPGRPLFAYFSASSQTPAMPADQNPLFYECDYCHEHLMLDRGSSYAYLVSAIATHFAACPKLPDAVRTETMNIAAEAVTRLAETSTD